MLACPVFYFYSLIVVASILQPWCVMMDDDFKLHCKRWRVEYLNLLILYFKNWGVAFASECRDVLGGVQKTFNVTWLFMSAVTVKYLDPFELKEKQK